MHLGIEASNLRRGGGITHLREILRAADPRDHGFSRVTVWSGQTTLDVLPASNVWLRLERNAALDSPLPRRLWWQTIELERRAARIGCDLLFVPGGSYAGRFRPFVTMSRNMLPFEPRERARYGFSLSRLRLMLLERVQKATLRRADGVIFLNDYARGTVLQQTGTLRGAIATIPHGVDERFRIAPRAQRPLEAFSFQRPFQLLYVSIIDMYKHQWNVAEAVMRMRSRGMPVALDLIGPAYPPAAKKLDDVLNRIDPARAFVRVSGSIPYTDLPQLYAAADGFIFASSCENMPNIVLEAMAAGLPIASARCGPMPEILGDGGLFFDPEDVDSIESAVERLVRDREGRERWASLAFGRAGEFSWRRCATATYQFLARIVAPAGRPTRGYTQAIDSAPS